MPEDLPPDLRQFVNRQLQSDEYASEDDVLVAAVRAFRDLTQHHETLRSDVQHATAQADAGNVQPLDMEAIKTVARKRRDNPQAAA